MRDRQASGKIAAETNRKKHGHDFYSNIVRAGNYKGRRGGFASERIGADGLTGQERARIAGARGGRKSRKGSKQSEDSTLTN